MLSVIAFHAFPALAPGGFIGVDVFFVISGFLITGILLKEHDKGTFSLLRFYQRRVRRLFPALAVVLAATVLAAFAFGYPGTVASAAKHGVAAAFSVANITLWREAGYFDAASHLKPSLHLWSLGVEEQFYLVWPVLLAAALRGRRWLLAAAGGACILSLAVTEATNVRHASAAFFLPFGRVWELGTGAALAILVHRGGSGSRFAGGAVADLLGLVGVIAIVASAMLLDPSSASFGVRAVPAVAGTALVIWSGSREGGYGRFIRWTLASTPAVLVGAISYSLYLWHWPLLSLPAAAGVELDTTARIVLVALAFLLAALTYRWAEMPVRRAAAPVRAALLSCVALMSAAILCAVVYFHERSLTGTEQRRLAQALAWPPPDDGARSTCPRDVRAMDPPVSYCQVSTGSEPTAVVWGDSHADHYFRGLALQDPDRSWMLLGDVSCPPSTGIEVAADQPDCRMRSEAALRWLEKQGRIDTVVLGFFGHYPDETDVAHVHKHSAVGPSKVRIDGSLDGPAKARAFARGLEASVMRLEAAGKQVVIVVDVPELPFDPLHCFAQPRVRLSEPRCRVPASEVALRQSTIRRVIAGIAARHATVRVADPTPALCDLEFCGPGTAAEPIYRDSHHLSVHGSVLAANAILRAATPKKTGQVFDPPHKAHSLKRGSSG